MPDLPTVDAPLTNTFTCTELGLTYYCARTVETDGEISRPRVFANPMIGLFNDEPNPDRTHHYHADNATIREDLWLEQGVIVDTTDRFYDAHTGKIDGTWT